MRVPRSNLKHWKLWGNSSCFPCSQFVDGVESCQHCKGREGQSFDYSTDSKIKDRSRRVFLLERTFFCLACELPIILSPFILMCFCVGFFGFYRFYLPNFSFRGAVFCLSFGDHHPTPEEFTCAAFNPSGESVVLGNYNRILAPWSPGGAEAHGSPGV